jgi:class 3 adenylate cyclase/predicted ATPase
MDIVVWLRSLGLGKYEAAFRENEIDETVLPSLTHETLKELGVTAVGHRLKLLDAIAALRSDASGRAPSVDTATTSSAPSAHPEDRAERRQVTVMFSDLVGSTALSARMDPEDLREVITAYQKCVAETVQRFGGFVAKYMGDGVLIYFGYPQAHEDDAERAVRAGLELVTAVCGLKTHAPLQTRVGIATGLVVVGDLIGSGASQEQAIVGETPNLAARLQGIAEPNAVVIAESTRRLVGNLFELDDLGAQNLKGIAGPVRAWNALRPSSVESRFEALHAGALTELVGREEELELLMRRWSKAKTGEGQVVLLTGEAGIGKSRLTAALMDCLAGEPHTRLRYFCSPQHTDSALYPILSQMERAAGFAHDDTAQAKLDKLDALLAQSFTPPRDAVLLAEMLSLPNDGRYPVLERAPQELRQKTLEALTAQMEALSRSNPILMIFEDVHWIDPTSLEALCRTVDRLRGLGVLLIVTYRPEFEPPWIGRSYVTALNLNRLGEREMAAMIDRVAGNKPLPESIRQDIIERTDGVPLFVEEMTKAVLEAEGEGDARKTAAAVPSSAIAVPASLHASLMARLDRLGTAKEVAQIGAAMGREFSHASLAAVVSKPEAELQSALDRLVNSGLLFRQGVPPDASYLFKHALVQDAAYGTLLRDGRRALHARIAETFATQLANLAERQPEILARHLSEAGRAEQAVEQWLKAGRRAAGRSAHVEAIAHLKQGLELLASLPDWPRRGVVESDLQLALGVSLQAAKGLSSLEAASAYERARVLCETNGDIVRLVSALWGLWHSSNNSNKLEAAHAFCNQLLTLTEKHVDSGLRLQAQHAAWTTYFFRGEPIRSLRHCESGKVLYLPHLHQSHVSLHGGHDPGVCARMVSACDEWMIGHSDKGLHVLGDALRLAEELAHSYSRLMVLQFAAIFHLFRREIPTAMAYLDAADALAAEQRLSPFLNSSILHSALAMAENRADAAVANIREGMKIGQASNLMRPYYLGLLAEALAAAGDEEGARETISNALSMGETSGERWWEAELCRLRGELLRLCREEMNSEVWFQRSLKVSQRQGAKSLELRAATSLARLWRDQGKPQQARELLAPVYGWFTEGFDTRDLKEAKALLDELAVSS